MGTDPLDATWRGRGLGACSTEAILEALRRHGVEVDEEDVLRVGSLEQALVLGALWQEAWQGPESLSELPRAAAVELWRRLGMAQAPELPEELSEQLPAELEAEAGEPGLEPLYYERFAAASPEEQWVLAQQAVYEPGFRGADAWRLGSWLWERVQTPEQQQAFAQLLEEWEAERPGLDEEEPRVLLWRLALLLSLLPRR